MNHNDQQILKVALDRAQAGQREAGFALLKALEFTNPDDPDLLLWMVFTAPDLQTSQSYMERAVVLDPDHDRLEKAREWLEEQREQERLATLERTRENLRAIRPLADKLHDVPGGECKPGDLDPDEQDMLAAFGAVYTDMSGDMLQIQTLGGEVGLSNRDITRLGWLLVDMYREERARAATKTKASNGTGSLIRG